MKSYKWIIFLPSSELQKSHFYGHKFMYFIGIDIGSTSTKVAILDNQDNFCDLFLLSSSFSTIKIVRDIKEILEQKSYQEMPQSQLLDMEEQV